VPSALEVAVEVEVALSLDDIWMSLQNTFLFKDVSTDSFRGNWDLRFWIDACCPVYIEETIRSVRGGLECAAVIEKRRIRW
jgi:hypothetical protein